VDIIYTKYIGIYHEFVDKINLWWNYATKPKD